MYALSFDMTISDLKKEYGEKYHSAYAEIKNHLTASGFYWIQGSTYVTEGNLTAVYRAINILSNIDWFRKSVRDIRAFKVEDFSDFTSIVKG
ncbi:hypothetical protein EZ456_06420 [Pedobacter psychrodurus]|uniref:Endoribonuclease VapD n=2 Tax=Pedobacter psychrodurus TaxID=2530456 RepID=A0A4R0Q962_9SPHI|nr:hypothetical protein EZ456_06420 [Pedobacter psychrodurus]